MAADRHAGKTLRRLTWAALGAVAGLAGHACASAQTDCPPPVGTMTSCHPPASEPASVVPPGLDTVDEQWVSVWVDLELPALASVPREDAAGREALRLQIEAQQEAVMAGLRGLGAIEQARVKVVRNAIAVRLPRTRMEAARMVPGVRAVRPARPRGTHPMLQKQ